jgi:microcystin-dependent protein
VVFLLSHPIGSIYLTAASDENTAQKMRDKHGGTWTAWGQGRVPLGMGTSSGDPNGNVSYNTAEATGGSRVHVLSIAQLPNHSHQIQADDDYSSVYSPSSTIYKQGLIITSVTPGDNGSTNSTSRNTFNIGGGQAHNNLQPYITCYMRKRLS